MGPRGGGDPAMGPRGGGDPAMGPRGRPRRAPARTRLRNRRFAALRRLVREGRYFSEREMRARPPGSTSATSGASGGGGPPEPPPDPPSLAQLLLRSLDREPPQEDESSDEDGDPPAGERLMLRQEFITRMYQRFLDGEDSDFDYSQVDENPDMDNLDIVSRDAEERYFDEEEPSAAPQLD